MSLSSKENTGRVLGTLGSAGSLAAIAGMGGLSLISWLYESMPLQYYYLVGGIVIVLGAIFLLRLPNDLGTTRAKPARIVVKKEYWLYYVLIFLSGARKLVLGSFVTLMLVDRFGFKVWQVSTLMLVSGILNFVIGPYRGSLIDRFGERMTTPLAYGILALCCMGYAVVPLLGLSGVQSLWILIALWFVIKLAQPLGMGLSTYVYRTAPAEELTPTLTAGVTFDHISSVSMPFLYGALLPVIQYEGIFLALAILILCSIPFARALQIRAPAVAQPVPSGAE
jgi:predicted MFS family arabinose efflux permease